MGFDNRLSRRFGEAPTLPLARCSRAPASPPHPGASPRRSSASPAPRLLHLGRPLPQRELGLLAEAAELADDQAEGEWSVLAGEVGDGPPVAAMDAVGEGSTAGAGRGGCGRDQESYCCAWGEDDVVEPQVGS